MKELTEARDRALDERDRALAAAIIKARDEAYAATAAVKESDGCEAAGDQAGESSAKVAALEAEIVGLRKELSEQKVRSANLKYQVGLCLVWKMRDRRYEQLIFLFLPRLPQCHALAFDLLRFRTQVEGQWQKHGPALRAAVVRAEKAEARAEEATRQAQEAAVAAMGQGKEDAVAAEEEAAGLRARLGEAERLLVEARLNAARQAQETQAAAAAAAAAARQAHASSLEEGSTAARGAKREAAAVSQLEAQLRAQVRGLDTPALSV